MKYLLKNAKLLSGETACVVTDGAYITYVGAQPSEDSYDRIIDCTDRLLMPGLYNCHTHAAMTLFRGYGEDMPLDRWLHEKIFPAEDLLTSRAVYNASMLAIAVLRDAAFHRGNAGERYGFVLGYVFLLRRYGASRCRVGHQGEYQPFDNLL